MIGIAMSTSTTSTAASSASRPIAPVAPAPVRGPAASPVRHSWIDNLQGQFFGVVMVAFGMSMLHSLGLIIGQIAGVAFLVSYGSGISFGLAFTLINLPFYLLAALRMGAAFTWRTLAAVTAVSLLTNIAGNYISYRHLDPAVGAVLAGLCVGIGLIALFRHQASCGGMSILAAYVQERTGFKAGWLLMGFDLALFATAAWFLPMERVLYSLAGAITMNLFVAWNHRYEWYIAR
ncbi:membrane protein [Herbaspirillum seropedicae]|uniref:Transmembrane protein n=2 Tax=Herbaspirillum seropedicae TaxID=964 RepID=D8IVX6_HERSS|nr:transmembrane protein [Herbaspirillum seropedicae SmR1]AKN67719.1 membrane protein [Herbaspirillum seropedicae]NQE29759.1 membrane protein [Herbaspirillum seropedicae]